MKKNIKIAIVLSILVLLIVFLYPKPMQINQGDACLRTHYSCFGFFSQGELDSEDKCFGIPYNPTEACPDPIE